MESKLYSKAEVVDFINAGRIMLLSGSPKALEGLPQGKWIAGSTPYFVDGVGVTDEDKIFVNDFTLIAKNAKVAVYDAKNIQDIAVNGYDNGITLVSIPIDTDVYYTFANNSMRYQDIFKNPVVGYIAATKLEEYGKAKPFTATGIDGKLTSEKAVVLYVELPEYLSARTEIENFDTIDEQTPEIIFPKDGFVQSDCLIDGKPGNIAEYFENVVKPKIGGYTQMITSQNGALINRDTKIVDTKKGEVTFFSPVYAGDKYHLVKNGQDYLKMFNDNLSVKRTDVVACFSCVSYFFGGDFTGKKVVTNGNYAFGEIAYQLLNKTIVTLEIDRIA
ncbi:MAG: hypothetical protein II956_01675 [Bacteroidales bacterium]|nr:hypothetical protein [Bacteroidales bacterium]